MFPMLILDNFFNINDLDHMVESIAESNFKPAPNNNSSENLQIMNDHIIFNKFDKLSNKINELVILYYNKKIIFYTSKSVARYTKNGYIGKHRDWEPNDPYVIENNKPRIDLASVFYLNDDYIGGEINFYSKFEDNIPYMSLKPQKGTCIFFDSSIYHMTNPIVSGIKYSYTTFYQLGAPNAL